MNTHHFQNKEWQASLLHSCSYYECQVTALQPINELCHSWSHGKIPDFTQAITTDKHENNTCFCSRRFFKYKRRNIRRAFDPNLCEQDTLKCSEEF